MIELEVGAFLAADDAPLVDRLATDAIRHFRSNEAAQLRAWEVSLRCLRAALADWPGAASWRLVLEFPMKRLGRRIDAVLVTPRAILVLEFKADATTLTPADRRQVEDYALDLQDFHAGSRNRVIVPILVATAARPGPVTWPLAIGGVAGVMDAAAATLPALLRDLWARLPDSDIDVAGWSATPYRPVPGIVDAARTLYARNSVAEIADAGAEARNLRETTQTILAACREARAEGHHVVIFVTGTPGAGKTLCGLNVVFGAEREAHATFLTGNPTLVHVLREALVRDAVAAGQEARAARQRMRAAIQALPHFRDHHIGTPTETPADRIAVIDEAQRSWSQAYAARASADRPVRLTDSEPGHLLDIMARHADWAAMVCLIGNGQEIHTGEGGLAEWGEALAARPHWRVLAAPQALRDPEPRQRLPALPGLRTDEALHLDIAMRSIRNPAAAAWADAVVRGEAEAARAIAALGPLPFLLVRDQPALHAALRAEARGERRAGLVGSGRGQAPAGGGDGRGAAAHGCQRRCPLVPRSLAGGCACLRRAGDHGHRIRLPGAGAGRGRAVLGRRPYSPGRHLAGAGFPWHRLAGGARCGSSCQPSQHLSRAAHPRALSHHRLGAARQRSRPHPQSRGDGRHRRLSARLRHPGIRTARRGLPRRAAGSNPIGLKPDYFHFAQKKRGISSGKALKSSCLFRPYTVT